jgi:hypothetical protein
MTEDGYRRMGRESLNLKSEYKNTSLNENKIF